MSECGLSLIALVSMRPRSEEVHKYHYEAFHIIYFGIPKLDISLCPNAPCDQIEHDHLIVVGIQSMLVCELNKSQIVTYDR